MTPFEMGSMSHWYIAIYEFLLKSNLYFSQKFVYNQIVDGQNAIVDAIFETPKCPVKLFMVRYHSF